MEYVYRSDVAPTLCIFLTDYLTSLFQQIEGNLLNRLYVGDGILHDLESYMEGISKRERNLIRRNIEVNYKRGTRTYDRFSSICFDKMMAGAEVVPFLGKSPNMLHKFISFNISVYYPLYQHLAQERWILLKD